MHSENSFESLKKFDIDSWFAALSFITDDYNNLKMYVKNKRVRKAFLDSINFITIDLTNNEFSENKEVMLDKNVNDKEKQTHLESVDIAFRHYSNQMLVILVSYLELIINEFFEIFQHYKTDRIMLMEDFEVSKVKKGIKFRISKIEKLCSTKFDETLKKELIALVKRRNNIVHRMRIDEISSETIEGVADKIITFLRNLGLIMKKNKIPITHNSGLVQ